MTLQEFKAWFEGYTENIDKQPTQKQWARIKERVGEIDGKVVTERVYVDRYWPYHRAYGGPLWNVPLNMCNGTTGALSANAVNGVNGSSALGEAYAAAAQDFNSSAAMYSLGKAEAEAA